MFSIITITYFGQGDKNYVTKYSYENNVITLTIPPNNNTKRHFTVELQYSVNWNYSTHKGVDFIFRFDYYQQGIETT